MPNLGLEAHDFVGKEETGSYERFKWKSYSVIVMGIHVPKFSVIAREVEWFVPDLEFGVRNFGPLH
jgi:hypothetical protein